MTSSPDRLKLAPEQDAAFASEAGLAFEAPQGISEPLDEWLGLMEVVQMLCAVWPARDQPMLGGDWRL